MARQRNRLPASEAALRDAAICETYAAGGSLEAAATAHGAVGNYTLRKMLGVNAWKRATPEQRAARSALESEAETRRLAMIADIASGEATYLIAERYGATERQIKHLRNWYAGTPAPTAHRPWSDSRERPPAQRFPDRDRELCERFASNPVTMDVVAAECGVTYSSAMQAWYRHATVEQREQRKRLVPTKVPNPPKYVCKHGHPREPGSRSSPRNSRCATCHRLAQNRRQARKLGATVPALELETRARELELQGEACAYCAGPGGTVEHVIPLSRGGLHVPENLASACQRCNSSKRDLLVDEWVASGRAGLPARLVT